MNDKDLLLKVNDWIEIKLITWTSLSLRLVAIWLRSVRLKYFFAWNSRSSSSNCSDVKAVRRRLDFELPLLDDLPLSSPPSPLGSIVLSSSEQSDSDWSISEMRITVRNNLDYDLVGRLGYKIYRMIF